MLREKRERKKEKLERNKKRDKEDRVKNVKRYIERLLDIGRETKTTKITEDR
jgi:hypothetical protein